MSGKIKAKDLSYDASLPPFLQRLHAQNAGRGDTDRHERPLARPKRDKDPNEDNGPTVVDESGETLTKDEVAKLTDNARPVGDDVAGEAAAQGEGKLLDGKGGGEGKRTEERKMTDGVATKKRKAGKIVGDEQRDAEKPEVGEQEKKAVKKAKKKGKAIKLAFDDEEEG